MSSRARRAHRVAEAHQRRRAPRRVGAGRRAARSSAARRGVDHVVDLRATACGGCVSNSSRRPSQAAGCSRQRLAREWRSNSGTSRELLERDQPGAHAVVDVVGVVGDLVGQVAQLRLQARLRAVQEAPRHAARLRAPRAARRCAREQCLRMPSRVSNMRFRPSKCRIALLQRVDHAQALQVVLEAAVLAPCSRSARPGRRGRRACGRGRAPARSPRPGPRSGPARARSSAPSCATSSECVSRVRNRSPSWLRKTWVL